VKVTRTAGRDGGAHVGQAIQAHLVERPHDGRLRGDLLKAGGQLCHPALEVGEALFRCGHQVPASASGSSACRAASQAGLFGLGGPEPAMAVIRRSP